MQRNLNILIADEPAGWINTFAGDLQTLYINMHIVQTEEQGFDIIRQNRLDLALIASDVPRFGGLEFIRRVHRYSEELPVIVLGSRIENRWLQEALKIGVKTILPRPINIDRLVEVSMKILCT